MKPHRNPAIVAALVLATAGLPASSAGAAAQAGRWQLVSTVIYEGMGNSLDISDTLSLHWKDDYGSINDISGELGAVVISKVAGAGTESLRQQDSEFIWPKPPTTAKSGVKYAFNLHGSNLAYKDWWYTHFIANIDHADIKAKFSRGWKYSGSELGGYEVAYYAGSLVFPAWEQVAKYAGGPNIRLQVDVAVADVNLVVQYIYKWVKYEQKAYRIVCVKGKRTVIKTGPAPKCPKGFKLKSKKVVS